MGYQESQGQPCDQCDDTTHDYVGLTDSGDVVCEHCLAHELDGIDVEYQGFLYGDEVYAASATVYLKSAPKGIKDMGLSDYGPMEAIDLAKERALALASRFLKNELVAPMPTTHRYDLVLGYESHAPDAIDVVAGWTLCPCCHPNP